MTTTQKKPFLPGANDLAFNNIAKDTNLPFEWTDKTDSGNIGAMDHGEIEYRGNPEERSRYIDGNGDLTPYSLSLIARTLAPYQTKLGILVITDRINNGDTNNDTPKGFCDRDWTFGPDEKKACEAIERSCSDPEDKGGIGLRKGGDWEGLIQIKPFLRAIGFDAIHPSPHRPENITHGFSPELHQDWTTETDGSDKPWDWCPYTGYNPVEFSFDRINRHLISPSIKPEDEWKEIRRVISAFNQSGMRFVVDLPIGANVKDIYAYSVDSGILYYNGEVVGNELEEASRAGLLYIEKNGKDVPLSPLEAHKKWQVVYGCRKQDGDILPKTRETVGPSDELCSAYYLEKERPDFRYPQLGLLDPFDYNTPRNREMMLLHTQGQPDLTVMSPNDLVRQRFISRGSIHGMSRLDLSKPANFHLDTTSCDLAAIDAAPISPASRLTLKAICTSQALRGLDIDLRVDSATGYDGGETIIDEIKMAIRGIARGLSHVYNERYDGMQEWDREQTGVQLDILGYDPQTRRRKNGEAFGKTLDFGTQSHWRQAFIDDQGSLEPMQYLIKILEKYGFSPEIERGLSKFIDQHDNGLFADYIPTEGRIIRATNDQIVLAHLALMFTSAPIFIPYSTLGLARADYEVYGIFGRSTDPHNRPVVYFPEEGEGSRSSWNIMQNAASALADFRIKRHGTTISYGSFKPGLVRETLFGFGKPKPSFGDAQTFAVRRDFHDEVENKDDIIMQLVVRGNDGKKPEDLLGELTVNLPNGKYRDALTGIVFQCDNGKLSALPGQYYDVIHGRKVVVDAGRIFFNPDGIWHDNVSDVDFVVAGGYADLPDGNYLPVTPPEDKICHPKEVYESTEESAKYINPYMGCSSLDVKNGIVTAHIKPNYSNQFPIRSQPDHKFTLPDGQYFYDSGKPSAYDPRGAKAKSVKQVINIKDGKVVMGQNTQVLWLEKA